MGGIVTLVGGVTGEVFGGVATTTGIGAALGVPAMAVSAGLVVGGLGNIGAGIRGLLTTGSGSIGPQGKVPAARNVLKIGEEQFGKKIGKHAIDYGLDPGNPAHREALRDTIRSISNNPDKVMQGTFKGQEGLVDFFIKGNDVVIGKGGEFVTLMKDGINNPAVRSAMGLP